MLSKIPQFLSILRELSFNWLWIPEPFDFFDAVPSKWEHSIRDHPVHEGRVVEQKTGMWTTTSCSSVPWDVTHVIFLFHQMLQFDWRCKAVGYLNEIVVPSSYSSMRATNMLLVNCFNWSEHSDCVLYDIGLLGAWVLQVVFEQKDMLFVVSSEKREQIPLS